MALGLDGLYGFRPPAGAAGLFSFRYFEFFVYALMLGQVIFLCKSFGTGSAFVRLFASMDAHVNGQVVFSRKFPATSRTSIGLAFFMYIFLMMAQVGSYSKVFVAVGAWVGFFACMSALVDYEAILVEKSFCTYVT